MKKAWGMADMISSPSLRFTVPYLKALMAGLVVGHSLAFILGRSVWLEMRVNIGHAIPVAVICFVLFAVRKRRSIGLGLFLFLELLAASLLLTIYGFTLSTVLTVPAAFFRDAFHLNAMSVQSIGSFLLCLMGMGNVLWVGPAVIKQIKTRTGKW